jgi:hypothetical protein
MKTGRETASFTRLPQSTTPKSKYSPSVVHKQTPTWEELLEMKHSTTHKLTALAAGMSFAFIAGSASAFNLGEVWVGDQENGNIYIADQAALNNPFVDAPVYTIDLNAAAGGKVILCM